MSKDKEYGLGDAYAVQTPEDNKALYRDWAKSYDATFAIQRGYNYPRHLAQLFFAKAGAEDSPILDVGAGTGLVAEQLLNHQSVIIDGVDISPEMLEQSRSKGYYRELVEADLSAELSIEDARYGGIVSAGTFTHGHVGPAALRELLRVAKLGALFCLGVNAKAFDHYGFGSAFAALQAQSLISPLEFAETPYYNHADDEHGADLGYSVIFRKA